MVIIYHPEVKFQSVASRQFLVSAEIASATNFRLKIIH